MCTSVPNAAWIKEMKLSLEKHNSKNLETKVLSNKPYVSYFTLEQLSV